MANPVCVRFGREAGHVLVGGSSAGGGGEGRSGDVDWVGGGVSPPLLDR